jgi:hypothetical protein
MFHFTIRDLLWLMVVAGLAVGWCVQQRRLEAALATKTQELKAASDNVLEVTGFLYDEHHTHQMTVRDYSQIILDICTNEQILARNRQNYLDRFENEHRAATIGIERWDAERPSTLARVKQRVDADQETYKERAIRLELHVIELEAEIKKWQENAAANNSTGGRDI